MPHESSAVAHQLRELRAALAGHTARFDRVEEHVARIDHQLRDIHLLIARALDQGAASRVGLLTPGGAENSEESSVCERRVDSRQEERPEDRLEQRVSGIERRLARVEDRLDG
jgi:hypothetical protein